MDRLGKVIPKVSLPEAECGDWSIRRVEVKDSIVASFRERHFEPGTYTQLHHASRGLIMSDTPAERMDHLGFVHAAKGDVLISGLGLGMCLGAVLRKPEVERVTVLEIAPEVIEMVAPHYDDPRVTIIETCALKWKPGKGRRFTAVWHDIWDNICSDNKQDMTKLNRRYGRCADWYGCWSEDMLRYSY